MKIQDTMQAEPCALCGKESSTAVTNGERSVFICRSCLKRMAALARHAAAEGPDWFVQLGRMLCRRDPDEGQLSRLRSVLSTLPEPEGMLAALRADIQGGLDGVAQSVLAGSAMDFLREPSRKEYIMSGRSDLSDAFSGKHVKAFMAAGVYVLADLRALPDSQVLGIPGMDLALAAKCYAYRNQGQ